MQWILASSSPYRRSLLTRLGHPFDCHSPDIDETAQAGESPEALVLRLAIEKARAVATEYPHALVIGSDQVACYNGAPVGKPGNRHKAISQLQQFSAKTITFYTGLAVIDGSTQQVHSTVEPFTVHFRALTDTQIANYVDTEQPYDCAGSFKSEGLGIALFERFDGRDPNALIGLPMMALCDLLLQANAYPLNQSP